MINVVSDRASIEIDGGADNGVWLDPQQMLELTGWELKPEGLCRDDVCVPANDQLVQNNRIDAAAFWQQLDQPAASNEGRDAWFFGEGAQTTNDALLGLTAPDFTLPDFDGNPHSLHDFRRKRILLLTWASW